MVSLSKKGFTVSLPGPGLFPAISTDKTNGRASIAFITSWLSVNTVIELNHLEIFSRVAPVLTTALIYDGFTGRSFSTTGIPCAFRRSMACCDRKASGFSIEYGELSLSVNLTQYLSGATWAVVSIERRIAVESRVNIFMV
ncbi:MAG: hypothetical protein B6D64_11335 [Bacteroidetes bacterium 4484_276]|nr:MAG: hypothetical protein B6D64_11335 [Bacteroidetes bacterium 4484_276]